MAFSFFKKEFLGRIEALQEIELALQSLGPMFIFNGQFNMGEERVFPVDGNAAWLDAVDVNEKWIEVARGKTFKISTLIMAN
jgi:hypothetical protein